jgi:LCP family protein required for cell wall assembly
VNPGQPGPGRHGSPPGPQWIQPGPAARARHSLDDPGDAPFLPAGLPTPGGRRHRWWRTAIGRVVSGIVVLLVVVASVGIYEYLKLNRNISRVDALVLDDPAIRDAAAQDGSDNLLIVGSDTRGGANGAFEQTSGQVSGQRSDTMILAHVPADRSRLVLVSLPRDSWVPIPACGKAAAATATLNAALERGGPKCAVRTVQALTGVEVDHYVQVDFTGFSSVVDALGGVDFCSDTDAYDKASGLRLRRGWQQLDGAQALALARARKEIGDGSDLGRIGRQQQLIAAMIAKASTLVTNPLAAQRFLDAATRTLTMDRQTSPSDLAALGNAVRGLDHGLVAFRTAPIADAHFRPPGTTLTGKVRLDPVAGGKLWDSMIHSTAPPAAGAPATPPARAPEAPAKPGNAAGRSDTSHDDPAGPRRAAGPAGSRPASPCG